MPRHWLLAALLWSTAVHAQPMEIRSSQSADAVSGTLQALVTRPFAAFGELASATAWCDVLILDPNVHACVARGDGVEVVFGQAQSPVAFAFERPARTDERLAVRLTARSGPFGTRDYLMTFEVTRAGPDSARVSLAFSQRYGAAARMAMAAYYGTTARNKVGFTVVERDAAGEPVYVGDLRGGVERNLARQFLAILVFLDGSATTPDERVRAWLALTERHPRQLREDQGFYARKLPEVQRAAAERR
jgi:hypothetical protein